MNTNQYILKMMENPVHIAYLEDKKRQKSLVKDQDKKHILNYAKYVQKYHIPDY